MLIRPVIHRFFQWSQLWNAWTGEEVRPGFGVDGLRGSAIEGAAPDELKQMALWSRTRLGGVAEG